ncbi:MAG: 30S ribosomal protein S1 [Deltaproteobacteria bacterium]
MASEKSFKELFEESLKGRHFSEGEVVEGTVIQVGSDYALIDIGYKSEGFISLKEFRDERGEVHVKEGDRFLVYIESIEDEEGLVQLSRSRAEALQVWDDIIKAETEGFFVEGIVVDKVKGGFSVDIGVKAFLPASQIDLRPIKNLNQFLGQRLKFKVIKLNKKRGNVVLSRRAVMEQERQIQKSTLLETLEEGKAVQGVVKNITEYGCFLDLGGIDGLLHITDMSWGRVKHPSELVSIGDSIQVKVLKYDHEKERVSLGLKQLQPDPWDQVKYKYRVGDRIKGKVVSLADYGAFVEIEKGVEGLIHVSEMSWTQKIKSPSQVVSIGQEAESEILEIDTVNRRISLGLKQTLANPWEALSEKYPPGTRIKGAVKNVTDFGVFVGIEEGIDGLIHVSDISWTQKNVRAQDFYKKGDVIEAVVLNIDPENEKFSLGIKQLTRDPWSEVEKKLKKGSVVEGAITKVVDFGYFVKVAEDVEGLVHISEITKEKVQDPKSLYKVGDTVRAEVLGIDHRERRISLSMKALTTREEKEDVAKYMSESGKGAVKKLGDILAQKLKKVVGKSDSPDSKEKK